MANKIIVYSVIMIMAVLLLLYACSRRENIPDLHRYVAATKSIGMGVKHKGHAVEIDIPVPAIYGADALPVPFAETDIVPASAASKVGVLNPLQAYPLGALQFVGTFSQGRALIAYIAAPDGMVYEAKEGDAISDQDAKIVHIESGRLSIEQVSQGGVPSTSILELKEDHP
ncbi:MAG: pilus assembly protein PilP [Gammaproteobacteria bacterium]